MSRGAATLGWQDIASVLCKTETGDRRKQQQRQRGHRTIPQETIRAIRAEAGDTPTSGKIRELATKHGVSYSYVYNVVHNGLRDDEREVFR